MYSRLLLDCAEVNKRQQGASSDCVQDRVVCEERNCFFGLRFHLPQELFQIRTDVHARVPELTNDVISYCCRCATEMLGSDKIAADQITGPM